MKIPWSLPDVFLLRNDDLVILKALKPQTASAHTINSDFNSLYFSWKRLLKIVRGNIQTLRIQTVHLSAIGTVEMRMGNMIFIWGQTKVCGSASSAQTFNQLFFNQQIQNPIYGYPIY